MNEAATNNHVQVFVWTVFTCLGQIPRSNVAGSYGECMFNLKETAKLFSNVAKPFHIPWSDGQSSNCSPTLGLDIFRLLLFGFLSFNRCVVAYYCGFNTFA